MIATFIATHTVIRTVRLNEPKSSVSTRPIHKPLARRPKKAVMTIGTSPSDEEPVILLTNDDGICPEGALILRLAKQLVTAGHDIIVCAPGANNSACGMRISLSGSIKLRRHREYEEAYAPEASRGKTGTLSVFSIDGGTPADCVIVAIEPGIGLLSRLGKRARLVLSGINVGQNLGNDVLYSGTFSAARQAAMYGIAAMAVSVDIFSREPNCGKYEPAIANAMRATNVFLTTVLSQLPAGVSDLHRFNWRREWSPPLKKRAEGEDAHLRLLEAFSKGDVVFNVNVPIEWDGTFKGTTLDCVLYDSCGDVKHVPSGIEGTEDETCTIKIRGNRREEEWSAGSDMDVAQRRGVSVTPVSTWPYPHVLALSQQFYSDVLDESCSFWRILAGEPVDIAKL